MESLPVALRRIAATLPAEDAQPFLDAAEALEREPAIWERCFAAEREVADLRARVRALEGALKECDRRAVDAFDCTDPVIYEKDWGSDSPRDSLRALHAILTQIRSAARAVLGEG